MSSPRLAPLSAIQPNRTGERFFALGFVVWVGLLGADRVDLLGGSAGFVLTPFLALTPLLLAGEGLRLLVLRAAVRSPERSALVYAAVLLAFLCLAMLSALLGQDVPASARRSLHLVAISSGTLVMALTASRRPWFWRALALGSGGGLILALVFNVVQVHTFAFDGLTSWNAGPVSVALEPGQYAGIVPRLTGQVADPNRAGLLFLFYIFALFHGGRPGPRRRILVSLGVLFIVATLSRSVAMTAIIVLGVALLARSGLRVSRQTLLTASAVLGLAAGIALVSPGAREGTARALAPLAGRFSLEEGSAQEHTYLLERGVEEGTRSVRRAALGMGYGTAFHALQDVFPGNKYGNFHSLYFTVLAESGVFALLAALVLMAGPLLWPGPFLPLVAGLWFFNFFYQAAAEPAFWFILALAWSATADLPRPAPGSKAA